ncbi:hypothetical protein LC087_18840 (plasmid) [Bacillus carboniphilus]|uniref:Uncharacterized protein n=1 Tax=Bacillus carboniphilus TaxID=86663 RepID=A0ABY9JYG8_9BACI|nr:hypothetical protein [Bacillus carboniphilus]WLR44441.1 hypothetical protein LC087_18840 [Bacillus carboniphilus]
MFFTKKETGIIMLLVFYSISPFLIKMMDLNWYLWVQGMVLILSTIPIYSDYKEKEQKGMPIFILVILLVSVISGKISF